MKLHHFGDIHYDEARHRRPAPDGIDQGWHDVARAVEVVVDAAIATAATEPTALVFGGDLSRTRKPSPHTYEHFAGQLARAHAAGVPTIAIPGNHDISSNGEAHALAPLAHLPGFHLFDQPGVAYILPPSGVGAFGMTVERDAAKLRQGDAQAAIVCVPWVSRAVAAANVEPGTSSDELLLRMAEAVLAMIKAAVLEPLAAGVPTYLLYHGTIAGGHTATGQAAHLFHEPVVSAIDLGNLGLEGVMLNHLHKRQEIGSINPGSTPIVYSSSVERLTFGDESDTKGWVEWSVGSGYVFRDTPARRFVTIDADQLEALPDVDGAIVRVRLTAEHDLEPAMLERTLYDAGAHRVAEIVVERDGDRVEHQAADLARTDPLEALADWLAAEHPDEPLEWRDEILAAGAALLGRGGSIETRQLNADTITTPIPNLDTPTPA